MSWVEEVFCIACERWVDASATCADCHACESCCWCDDSATCPAAAVLEEKS